jgi:hypothetical protein
VRSHIIGSPSHPSGVGVDSPIVQGDLTLTDSVVGSDGWSMSASFSVTDSGQGADAWTSLTCQAAVGDTGVEGNRRTFLHPSGDSFAVLVTDFEPESSVDEYDRRIYRLTLKETR